jgi:hypothetical protein
MNTYAKYAAVAVIVIAIGAVGLAVLRPGSTPGVGGPTAASPSPSAAPTGSPSPTPIPEPTAAPLTGQFTSDRHGFSISYPEGWSTRPATTAWSSGIVDYFNQGADLLVPGSPEDPGGPFVALASQPLGDRTREQFEADYWQIMVDDDPAAAACASMAEPITIDDAAGVMACDSALVIDGGRGYVAELWSSDGPPYDEVWLASVLATMVLHPEDAVDTP